MGIARGIKSVADSAMMVAVLLLISGASGAGKSSVRQGIAADIEPAVAAVELDGQGRHLLLAGDPVAPGEVLAAPSAPVVDVAICRLDVDEDAQRDRLRRRGDPEELLPRHVAFADWMRRHARDPRYMPEVLANDGWPEMKWSRLTTMPTDRWRISVIDGSKMTRAEANQTALQWVSDAIEGRAPVFRRSATSKR